MTRLIPVKTDFTTLFGRLIVAFRKELRLSQTQLGERLRYDRSLIARLEAGRNIANLDNLHKLERLLIRQKLLERHGDLVLLAHRVASIFAHRGIGVVYGKLEEQGEVVQLDLATIDRVVAGVLDSYLAPPAEPVSEGPDAPWGDEE